MKKSIEGKEVNIIDLCMKLSERLDELEKQFMLFKSELKRYRRLYTTFLPIGPDDGMKQLGVGCQQEV